MVRGRISLGDAILKAQARDQEQPLWLWPPDRLGEGLQLLVAHVSAQTGPPAISAPLNEDSLEPATVSSWLSHAAQRLGMEMQAVSIPYAELAESLPQLAPAVLRIETSSGSFFALLQRGGAVCTLVGRDHRLHFVRGRTLLEGICRRLESTARVRVIELLSSLTLPPAGRNRAEQALMREWLGPVPVEGIWPLRLPAGAPFSLQLKQAGLLRTGAGLVGLHLITMLLMMGSWALIGRATLSSGLETSWLMAWGLLLVTLQAVQMSLQWREGVFAIGISGLLKRRLLAGALRLNPDILRTDGAGRFLSRVLESAQVESLALGGGLAVLLGGIELILAGGVLSAGAGGTLHAGLLAVWSLLTLAMSALQWGRFRRWTQHRLSMTLELIEQLVGHRTRLVQALRHRWHEEEDASLLYHQSLSQKLDTLDARLAVLLPRGWMLLCMFSLGSSFLAGADPTQMAIGLGGALMAQGVLGTMTRGLFSLLSAVQAWELVGPLFHAAAEPDVSGREMLPASGRQNEKDASLNRRPNSPVRSTPLLEVAGLSWQAAGTQRKVLDNIDLVIHAGDRLLLGGPSGGGKSTLVSLLSGLREPQQGVMLLQGLDQATAGLEQWRRNVVAAPQFHENHVLSGTFAFNLLMGRQWPPSEADLQKAYEVCEALGLGPLLQRMPGKMFQMVGETGWQLSHGERSRLYIARAILQDARLVLLDESFAALDPENLALAMKAVLTHAETVMVVAHR